MSEVKFMEKFNYYFNTQEKIDEVLNGPINKSTMESVLFHLIWHAYYKVSQDTAVIIDYVERWMKNKTNIFHLSAYAKQIQRNIKRMDKMPWRDIQDTVKIRQSELEYIASFDDIKKEKLLFCYLAVAKFMDMSRVSPTHWESESDSAIFKMARVTIPSAERDYYIYDMIHGDPAAAIYLNYKNDDVSKRIDYISDDENDPVVLELDENNYYELAYTYLNWKNGGGFKKCKGCGRLFRVKQSIGKSIGSDYGLASMSLYCRNCSQKRSTPKYKGQDTFALDYEPKKIKCIDCGTIVYIDNYKNNTTCRCADCQHEANKLSKREWKRKRNES